MKNNETVIEQKWDKLLRIKTTGRDDSDSDFINYPYEPTPYQVLERLANSGYITKRNVLLDYGSGKGRVDFFLSYQTRCRSIGVEYNERIYETSLSNQSTAVSASRVSFVCENAADYRIPAEVDRCFFFNPFSIEVLRKALTHVLDSYYENPREIFLFFYYPSDEYIGHLMMTDAFMFEDEIDCGDFYVNSDRRERIMVFSVMP